MLDVAGHVASPSFFCFRLSALSALSLSNVASHEALFFFSALAISSATLRWVCAFLSALSTGVLP
jgi:hypothetical protein